MGSDSTLWMAIKGGKMMWIKCSIALSRVDSLRSLKQLAALMCICSLVSLGQERPDWARDLPNIPTKPGYIQGLGIAPRGADEATDWNKASEAARRDIIAQIRVRMTSTVTSKVKEVNKDGKMNFSEVFESVTQQAAEGTLEGLQIHRWYDTKKNTLYAYAELSKLELEARFDEFFHNSLQAAREYFVAGKSAISDGNPFLGTTRYFEALKLAVLAESYLNKPISGDLDNSGVEKPLVPFLQSELCRVLGDFHFAVLSGSGQQAERGRTLQRPLIGRITYGGTAIPVRNALLTAAFLAPAEGELSGEFRSDDQGEFKVAVNEVKQGEAVSRIRVGVDLKGLGGLVERMPDAVRCWKLNYVDFEFTMNVRANLNIAMHVLERNLGKTSTKSTVQERLQRRLNSSRYTIIDESKTQSACPFKKIDEAIEGGVFDAVVRALSPVCDVVIVGFVETKERSNPMAGMFFSTGTASIQVIEVRSGRIIASASLNDEKEGGNTYEIAGSKLLNRMGDRIGAEIKEQMDKVLQ